MCYGWRGGQTDPPQGGAPAEAASGALCSLGCRQEQILCLVCCRWRAGRIGLTQRRSSCRAMAGRSGNVGEQCQLRDRERLLQLTSLSSEARYKHCGAACDQPAAAVSQTGSASWALILSKERTLHAAPVHCGHWQAGQCSERVWALHHESWRPTCTMHGMRAGNPADVLLLGMSSC